jgi:uncharacterized paraquat-inducible protein A
MFAAMSFDPRLLWDRLEILGMDSSTFKKADL